MNRWHVPTAIVMLALVTGCGLSASTSDDVSKGEKHKVEYAAWVDGPYDLSSFSVAFRDGSGNMNSATSPAPAWNESVELADPPTTEVSLDARAQPDPLQPGLQPAPNVSCSIKVDGVEHAAASGPGVATCHVSFADLDD